MPIIPVYDKDRNIIGEVLEVHSDGTCTIKLYDPIPDDLQEFKGGPLTARLREPHE